jgi:SAM-dependent methyltransferase
MIDRENLTYIENVLSLHNKNVNLDSVYEILTALKEGDEFFFYTTLLRHTNPNLDTNLLNSILKTIKHNQNLRDDIYDSYSENQFASKGALLDAIDDLSILDKDSTVFIWGCWYGSILIPALAPKVKKIIALDLDDTAIQIGKKFFGEYDNVEFQCVDVFEKYLNAYKDAKLIINTSCEHMLPMKEWKWFGPGAIAEDTFKGLKGEGFGSPKLSSECYFAFQSNNMFGIKGHVNCVNNLEEFELQLPNRAEVLYREEVEDTRGTRYMLVGKFSPLLQTDF